MCDAAMCKCLTLCKPPNSQRLALHNINQIQEPNQIHAKNLPTVPRPPIGIDPNLLNGTENVTTFDVTLRITMTLAGSAGISFEDILLLLSLLFSLDDEEEENGFSEMYPLKTPIPMAAAGNKRNAVPRGPGPLPRVPGFLVVVDVGVGRL